MEIYNVAWSSLGNFLKRNNKLILQDNLMANFVENCEELHKKIISEYMKIPSPESKDEIQLDRHKLAAVVAITLSKGDYVRYSKDLEDNILLGKYLAAIYVACSLVEKDMNNDLKEAGLLSTRSIITLCLPDPVICDTKSANTLARMLIWEERKEVDDCIRVLELANTLFLIEQYTLLMNNIDIKKWTEYQKEHHQ